MVSREDEKAKKKKKKCPITPELTPDQTASGKEGKEGGEDAG